ncbi:MAG: alpha/beta fold hydrolase [Phycisphaerales bacterium]|nr:alpha/beta fold hydrolase [Phycisphaerales bacterium]
MTVGAVAAFEFFLRNWALISIFLTLSVLVGVPALILCKYVRIIVNIFQDATVPMGMEARDYTRVEGERVEFRAFDGHRLYGRFLPSNPNQPVRGMLIFAHELDSDSMSAARYCGGLLDAGYEVFAFDFRNQGESSPESGYKSRLWPSDREQSDVLGAIAFVEDWLERQGRKREVGLVGVSRGAGAAILGAVGVPAVRAIMVDGAFSTDAYLEYLMRRWVSIFAKVRLVYENHPSVFWRFLRWLSIREASRRLNCRYPAVRKAVPRLGEMPMLFIHGERDGHIPVDQSRLLHDLAAGPKYLWVCPAAKHNQSVAVQPNLYRDYSVRFFDEHLAKITRDERLDGAGLLSQLAQPLAEPSRVSYAKYVRPSRALRR